MTDPKAWGIAPGYVDAREQWQDAPPETIAAVLEAMGAEGDAPPESPVVIARAGAGVDLGDTVEVRFEDGGSTRVDGLLPPDTPLGYHRVVARDGRERELIVSPGKCYLPERLRSWGWAVQLYAARSARSWGVGDLGDLADLARWARRTGADLLLVNPLHAPQPGPQQPSPYFPSSRRWRNPLYVRIEDVPGAAERLDDLDDLAAQGRKLNAGDRIDRDEVYRLKMEALERLWRGRTDDEELHRFRARYGSSLTDFATYMTLVERYGGGPSTWPAELRDPAGAAVQRFRVEEEERVLFHEWVQWLLERQLVVAAAGEAGLVHDLAIGVDPEGADAWLWRDAFARGVTVGAPPDLFNSHGQNWGLPPLDPWRLRAAAYRPFVETVRANLVGASGIRIDHVLGLFRLFWIPEGAGPADGTYVRYPYEDLLDILALESHRAGAFVAGEDLGTVEDVVPEQMQARDMLSYRLLWFDEQPETYPELSLAAVTNHDLPTVAGMWTGDDLVEQRELGLDPNEEAEADVWARFRAATRLPDDAAPADAVRKAYALLAKAPSAVVVATLEDALEVRRRPNQPGTTDERPNWSMPLPVPIEELDQHPLANDVAQTIARGRIAHGYARLSEVKLHYAEAGPSSGPVVVMLHGYPEFWYSWRHQIPFLAQRGFRVVAPDMRGYNLSDKPSGVGAYRIQNLVRDVAELVEELGGRASVVGHDWGGVVAWYFAMSHPVMLDRLAILNAPHPQRYVRSMGPGQMRRSWYIGFFQLPWLPERFVSQDDFAVLRKLFRHDPSRRGAFTEEDVELYVEAARRSDALTYPINYYRALFRPNPLPALRWRVVERPVQVIWGDKDRFLEASLAEPDRTWVPDVTIHRFPDASHWVQHDDPAEVNRLLAEFLGA
ncbi:MAG TPA: 4-alpha-glucanotransferase [Actinomycetota bacterium]|nr:4-alpha-glucanotransferase [Actinomycetota bacterium]